MLAPISLFTNFPETFDIVNSICIIPSQDSNITYDILVAVLNTGELCLFHLKGNTLFPNCLLVGHKSPITALVSCRIELEEVPLFDNAVVSASNNGELCLWDIVDGRSLHTNTRAFEGSPTTLKVSTSANYLFCAGMGYSVSIVQLPTLEVLKTIQLHDDWTFSFYLKPSEKAFHDELIFSTYSGALISYLFNENTKTIINPASNKASIMLKGDPGVYIDYNPWDSDILICLQNKICSIYSTKGSFRQLTQIEAPQEKYWAGGQFFSMKCVILWTHDMECHLYFLGPASDLIVLEGSRNDKSLMFLASNQGVFIYIDKRKAFEDIIPTKKTLLVEFRLEQHMVGTICIVPTQDHKVRALGFNEDGHAYSWNFKDCVQSLNLSPSDTLKPIAGALLPQEVDFNILASSDEKFSNVSYAILIMEKYLALGFSNGDISFIALNEALITPLSDLKENDDRIPTGNIFARRFLQGHTNKVTSIIYFSMGSGCDLKHVLASGSADCTVRLWDLETGALMKTFLNHSGCVTTLVPCTYISEPSLSDFSSSGNGSGGLHTVLSIMHMKHCLISVGLDNTVCVIDPEEMYCKFRFPGHEMPVKNIFWKCTDEVMIVECTDSSLYVWQLKTGHLDRKETTTSTIDDILLDYDWGISIQSFTCNQQYGTKKALSIFDVSAKPYSHNHVYFTIFVNVKRLISEINSGSLILARPPANFSDDALDEYEPPQPPPLISVHISSSQNALHHSFNSGQAKQKHPSLERSKSENGSSKNSTPKSNRKSATNSIKCVKQKILHPHLHKKKSKSITSLNKSLTMSIEAGLNTYASNGTAGGGGDSGDESSLFSGDSQNHFNSLQLQTDQFVVSSILSALMSWGIDREVDLVCINKLGLVPCGDHVVIGLKGVLGYFSIPFPIALFNDHSLPSKVKAAKSTEFSVAKWSVSPSATASRLLQILSMAKSVMSMNGLEDDVIALVTLYGTEIPKAVGKSYCYPSFAFLAKYIHDPMADVSEAARTLFASTLSSMSNERQSVLISYWLDYLPFVNPDGTSKPTKSELRATIILGMIAAQQPGILNNRDCKHLAESLDLALRDDTKGPYCIAAAEILGRGFTVWEPHLNGGSVLRLLIQYTGLSGSALVASKDTVSASPGGASGANGSTSGSHSPPRSDSAKGSSLSTSQTAGMPTHSHHGSNLPPSGASSVQPVVQLTSALMQTARQAVVQIATSNGGLFTSTVTFDLSHSKTASERIICLKLLGMFISKKPLILYPYLPQIVESIVKSLDPNTPYLRDTLQPLVTLNLSELVRIYPMVSFHAGSQRLAIGTATGAIIIYDLRTATRSSVMEQGNHPLSAVSISKDGKLVVTYSVSEACVRFWQPQGGFFGALVGAFAGGGINSTSVAGSHGGSAVLTQMKIFRSFNVGKPEPSVPPQAVLEQIKFEWVSERGVKMKGIDGLELAFTV